MTTKENGGPAFPHHFMPDSIGDCSGMELRDHFAAAALQGMLCNGFIPSCAQPEGSILQKYDYPAIAYMLADQMLEKRK